MTDDQLAWTILGMVGLIAFLLYGFWKWGDDFLLGVGIILMVIGGLILTYWVGWAIWTVIL